jgi:hypothetical protein
MTERPQFLYKYRSMNSRGLKEIFEKNTLYYPSPKQFNDPFDSQVRLTADGDAETIIQKIESSWAKFRADKDPSETIAAVKAALEGRNYELFEKSIHEMQDQFAYDAGVFSLAGKNNDIVMWAHYADNHSGLCLEFAVSEKEPFFILAQKVTYQQDYPKVSYFTGSPDEWVRVLLTKSSHWRYEDEWRIFSHPGSAREYEFHPSLLTSVIFGCRMGPDDESQVKEWIYAGKCRPRFLRAKPKSQEFSLDIVAG